MRSKPPAVPARGWRRRLSVKGLQVMVVTDLWLERIEPGLFQMKPQLDRPRLQEVAIRLPFPGDDVPNPVARDGLAVGGLEAGEGLSFTIQSLDRERTPDGVGVDDQRVPQEHQGTRRQRPLSRRLNGDEP